MPPRSSSPRPSKKKDKSAADDDKVDAPSALADLKKKTTLGASLEARLDSIDAKLSLLVAGGAHIGKSAQMQRSEANLGLELAPEMAPNRGDKFDVFISHSKKLPESEDRAVWVADVVEGHGLVPFFDRTDLTDVSKEALTDAVRRSDVLVTVIDPFTFHSHWVFMENLVAANEGIPIVPVYDGDRFAWKGQLDKYLRNYPWFFERQCVELNKGHRRESVRTLLEKIGEAAARGRKPPAERIQAEFRARVPTKIGVAGSSQANTHAAVQMAHNKMLKLLGDQQPSIIICAFTCTHDAEAVAKHVHDLSPNVPMIGCTTCRGVVLNEMWLTENNEYALGLWGLCDDGGSFTTIHIDLEERRRSDLRNEVYHQVTTAMVEHGGGGDESSDGASMNALLCGASRLTGRRGESSGRDERRVW